MPTTKDEMILEGLIDTLIVGLIHTSAKQLGLDVSVKVTKKPKLTTLKIALNAHGAA